MGQIETFSDREYCCGITLNLYSSQTCEELATQAEIGRHLFIVDDESENAVEVRLSEDNYKAWLPRTGLQYLEQAKIPYQPISVSRPEIEQSLLKVVSFAKSAMEQPNYYLWGGTVAPNYDCSGLTQAAFLSVGVWLPRDSYQQADFTETIPLEGLQLGDLIFFASKDKVNHVALSLGDGYYIHSSGLEFGRNGIGIDKLSGDGDGVGRNYYKQLCGAGRVMCSYNSKEDLKF